MNKILLGIFALVLLNAQYAQAADKKSKDATKSAPTTIDQFNCEADIFYTWQPVPPLSEHDDGAQQQGRAQAAAPTPTVEPPKPIEEFSLVGRHSDPVEQTAKDALTAKLPALQAQAMSACEQKHQAMSSCVAAKTKQFKDEFSSLEFDARRALVSSIQQDCRLQTGRCVSSRGSEVRCTKETIANPEAQATGAKTEKK